jgi:hypothetical protein
MKSVYLAAPLSHRFKFIMWRRYRIVSQIAGLLMWDGYIVFSPLSHSHMIAKLNKSSRNWSFWSYQDYHQLKKNDELFVLTLKGWEKSTGVQCEISWARELNMPIRYISFTNGFCGFTFENYYNWYFVN